MIYEYDGYKLPNQLQEKDTPELKEKREKILRELDAMADRHHNEVKSNNE